MPYHTPHILILKDRALYRPGAVSYGTDTGRADYDVIYLSYRPYRIGPIYTTIRILYLIGMGGIVYDIPTGRSTVWDRYPPVGVGIIPGAEG